MNKIIFKQEGVTAEVNPNTKVLKAAIDHSVTIEFVCSAARCGTCVIEINSQMGEVSAIKDSEKTMLESLGQGDNSKARLACQCRIISGTVVVDTSLQK